MNLNELNDTRLDDQVKIHQQQQKKWVSFEFFPPKSSEGVDNLLSQTLASLSKYHPLFLDMTWGAGGSTSELTFDLCKRMSEAGYRVNMHLTCTNMEGEKISKALTACKEHGIKNILALRGDPPAGQSVWIAGDSGLTCALDLVKYIREKFDPEDFCLSVAGYPEGHPSKISAYASYEDMTASEQARCSKEVAENGDLTYYSCSDADFDKEVAYLKDKVEAGANCIITQMFFDSEVFVSFAKACAAAGITVPIIPGIMCISNYSGFKRMVKFCKSRVPDELAMKIEAVKDDDHAMRELGIELGLAMCRRLIDANVPGLHFYTLNSSYTTAAILDQLQLLV
jgi:methylenetetrahydrofolate reductase (NADPH)